MTSCVTQFCSVLHTASYPEAERRGCLILSILSLSLSSFIICPWLLCSYHGRVGYEVKWLLFLKSVLRSETWSESAQVVFFWKLTGFSMPFLRLTSCLTRSVLCSLMWLTSKIHRAERRFWDAFETRCSTPGGVTALSRMAAISSTLQPERSVAVAGGIWRLDWN